MGSCPLEYDPLLLNFVDHQPISLDMTFPAALVVANKFVISVESIHPFALEKCADKNLELLEILASFFTPFDIFPELFGVDRD